MPNPMPNPMPAGRGEHKTYRIIPTGSSDSGKLTARKHYLGVDAVAWYVNRESSFWANRMASGTLDIKMSGGQERYQAALGTFELEKGAKVAPVFHRPVLPDRNYRGGPITLTASLKAIKRDTVVASMLKSAANASVGLIAGMVGTASVSGPAKLLTTAGEDLIGGVKKLLSDTEDKNEQIFDPSGLEISLQPADIVGPVVYLLLHRGTALNPSELEVKQDGQQLLPYYRSQPLDDGAWLLLALRRSDEYSSVRDWDTTLREVRGKIRDLVRDAAAEFTLASNALAQLQPGLNGAATLFDECARLRTIITNDGVLTEREASFQVSLLWSMLLSARDAIKSGNQDAFDNSMNELLSSLQAGRSPGGSLAGTIEVEFAALTAARLPSIVDGAQSRVAELAGSELFDSLQYLNRSMDSITS